LRLPDKAVDDRAPHSLALPDIQNIDVTDSAEIGPRRVGIGIEPTYSDESVVCQCAQQAVAGTAEAVGATCPVRDETVQEPKAMVCGFVPQQIETGGE
jgi:hypothetical protein